MLIGLILNKLDGAWMSDILPLRITTQHGGFSNRFSGDWSLRVPLFLRYRAQSYVGKTAGDDHAVDSVVEGWKTCPRANLTHLPEAC